MYEGTVRGSGDLVQFVDLDDLVRQLDGDHYQIEHDEAQAPPRRTLQILRRHPNLGNGYSADIVAEVRVDSDDLAQLWAAPDA